MKFVIVDKMSWLTLKELRIKLKLLLALNILIGASLAGQEQTTSTTTLNNSRDSSRLNKLSSWDIEMVPRKTRTDPLINDIVEDIDRDQSSKIIDENNNKSDKDNGISDNNNNNSEHEFRENKIMSTSNWNKSDTSRATSVSLSLYDHENDIIMNENFYQYPRRRRRIKRYTNNTEPNDIIKNTKLKIITFEDFNIKDESNKLRTKIDNDNVGLFCRIEKDSYLEFPEYRHYSCAKCYELVPEVLFFEKLVPFYDYLKDKKTGQIVTMDQVDVIKRTFIGNNTIDQWEACCEKAVECCINNKRNITKKKNSTGHLIDDLDSGNCPATWDGYKCWPESQAGSIVKGMCPYHIFYLDHKPVCSPSATKLCFPNGTWFQRMQHEWTNYTLCHGRTIYETRFIVGGLWHVLSALVIWPALLIMNRFPNRGNGKRVKIMSNLLLWLLVSDLINALQKIGIIAGLFHIERIRDDLTLLSKLRTLPKYNNNNNNMTIMRQNSSIIEMNENLINDSSLINSFDSQVINNIILPNMSSLINSNEAFTSVNMKHNYSGQGSEVLNKQNLTSNTKLSIKANSIEQQRGPFSIQSLTEPAYLVVLCWFLEICKRITRQLCYAWMFSGAVYLCSILLFAPAEPPAIFIRWLMILTNTFPVVLSIVYVIARTISESSPLNIMVLWPYYKIIGDETSINDLWSDELECWMLEASSNSIEEIADFPNLILVVLNCGLFITTLGIMCRINRPDSTRPEMSLAHYCKAAGTLVFLYGSHYALFVYRTYDMQCIKGQMISYATLFMDGIQGIAVSFVFCYKTPEGRSVIKKYWTNFQTRAPAWLRRGDRPHLSDTRANSSFTESFHREKNHSSKSDKTISTILNDKDTVIELLDGSRDDNIDKQENINSNHSNNNNNNININNNDINS